MSSRRKDDSEDHTNHRDEHIEPPAHRALSRLGWRLPTTESEVADVEKWASAQPVSERMKSRDALFGPRRGMPQLKQQTGQNAEDLEELLARAARDGGDISPEVAERMEKDREQAETDDTGNSK